MAKRVIQEHHLIYSHPDHPTQKEVTVKLTKGEHRIVSLMAQYTRKFVSTGFIKCLEVFVALRKDEAEKL